MSAMSDARVFHQVPPHPALSKSIGIGARGRLGAYWLSALALSSLSASGCGDDELNDTGSGSDTFVGSSEDGIVSSTSTGPNSSSATSTSVGPNTGTPEDDTSAEDEGQDCPNPSETNCNGFCADLDVDIRNCGFCGKRCDADELCSDGRCVPELDCNGDVACEGVCVDVLTDEENCGSCGRACDERAGEVCNAGNCGCRTEHDRCDGFCVDTQSDADHCGECNEACLAGEKCSLGTCRLDCPAGQTECGSSCVDTQSDVQHCGKCDEACASDEVCQAGTCRPDCAADELLCDDLCIDPMTDAAHCGACANTCDNDQICAEGSCVAACEASWVLCDGRCIDPATDPDHCGASGQCMGDDAGQVCTETQSCIAGSCEADPTWSASQRIDSASAAASDPRIAVDANGHAIAVWVQPNAGNAHLWSNRYNADTGSWGLDASSMLGMATPLSVGKVRVGIDRVGRAMAIWEQQSTAMDASEIHAKRYDPSTQSWAANSTVISSPGAGPDPFNQSNPNIAVDPAGNAMAVWISDETVDTNYEVYASHFDWTTKAWASAVRIEELTGNASHPRVTVDDEGNFTAVWLHQREGSSDEYDLRSNRYDASAGTWSSDTRSVEDRATPPSDNFVLGCDGQGDVHALWLHSETPAAFVVRWAKLARDEDSWSASVVVSEAGLPGQPSSVDLGVGEDGSAFAIWKQGSDPDFDIRATRYDPITGNWLASSWIIDGHSDPADSPTISVDSSGRAIALWTRGASDSAAVFSATYSPSLALWSIPTARSNAEASEPFAATGYEDSTFAVWGQEIDSAPPSTVFSARFGR